MTNPIQGPTQVPMQPGQIVGEQPNVTTDLRVVDPKQLPGPNGNVPNVSTEFKRGGNGQFIQVGSRAVPPPPQNPGNVQGPGSVFWRGFAQGIGSPAAFFSTAGAMRNGALNDQPFTQANFQRAQDSGKSLDDYLQGTPLLGAGFMIGRGIADTGNQIQGSYQPTEPPPAPVTVDKPVG